MIAIYKREMRSYFTSPIGYVYICAYLFAMALFFKMYMLDQGISNVVYFFGGSLIIYMFLVPILTMRLFSEEKKTKTDQILLTSPVSVTGIVLGKFLAAFSVFVIGLLPTGISIGILAQYGSISVGLTIGNYIGILMLGMSFVALGCFLSSVTEHSNLLHFLLVERKKSVILKKNYRFLSREERLGLIFVSFPRSHISKAHILIWIGI